jgi:hypothetical protein
MEARLKAHTSLECEKVETTAPGILQMGQNVGHPNTPGTRGIGNTRRKNVQRRRIAIIILFARVCQLAGRNLKKQWHPECRLVFSSCGASFSLRRASARPGSGKS